MKRSQDGDGGRDPGRKRPRDGTTNITMPCVLKILTPEVLASAIIGKGGTVISQMRQSTQAKIGLSDHSEFFPGTDCRILTAQGNNEESLTELCRQIIAKISESAASSPGEQLGRPDELRLRAVVPRAAAGGVIGRGGAMIKQLREKSGAKLSISDPVGSGPGAEQIVDIGGTQQALETVMSEVNHQVQAVNSEPWFQGWASGAGTHLSGGQQSWNGRGQSSPGTHGPRSGGLHGPSYGQGSKEVDLMFRIAEEMPRYVMEDSRGFALSCIVPNRLVGGIIGRGGTGTKEVQSLTGTKIGIREIPGDPENRTMNIAGPLASTCAAYMMMMKRYLDSEAASTGR